MSHQSEALKARTLQLAVAVLRLVDRFPRTPGAQVVASQLARSATSEGANYRAACTARSRREFIAKLSIVNEEADEVTFCEAAQLRAVFGRSLATARHNLRAQSLTPSPNNPMTK